MNILFWICWAIDILLSAIAIVGKGFADSFHKSSSVPWLAILIIGCTVGGFLFQIVLKKPSWALVLAVFPLLVMLGMYLYEKMTQ